MSVFINSARPLFLLVLVIAMLGGCSPKEAIVTEPFTFICTAEADNAPPLTEEAEKYYQEARVLAAPEYGIKDEYKITELFKKASDLGHWRATYVLAQRYLKSQGTYVPKYDEAIDLLENMANEGIPLGIYSVALLLRDGRMVDKNQQHASYYMHRAAELGSPEAQYYLGKQAYGRYEFALSKQYYLCAAAQNYRDAAYELGSDYEISEKNYPKAVQYYLKAAMLGHSIAMMSLQDIFTKESMDNKKFDYKPDAELAACFYAKYKALEKDPLLRFPNLATDCPIPLHPIMGDGSAYPDVELRSPGFLDRLKAAPHDPADEAMRTARRLKMLRDDYQRNKQSAIEEQNRPPLVKLKDLPYWIEPHVQIGTFFVKYNGAWVRAIDGYITPYKLMSDDLRYIEYYGGDNEYIEEEAFHRITQNILRHNMERRNGQLS